MGLKHGSSSVGLSAFVWLAMVLMVPETGTPSAALTVAQCKEQRRLGINACKPLLSGMRPSSECCYRIRVTAVECVCPIVTPELAALVKDLNKAIQIIESCGRRVPRHYKCGSIITP